MQNDWADDVSQNDDPRARFLRRRAAALRAYYEHLPLRRSSLPQGPDMRIYRKFIFGDLARFGVLDTRQYRSDQPCGDDLATPDCPDRYDPMLTMTGPRQERWLLSGLSRSRARWNVLANQVMMAEYASSTKPCNCFSSIAIAASG